LETTLPKLKLNPDLPTVAFHHSPIGIEYFHEAGVDVLIAGHTHGGQMFPWTLLAPLQFPYTKGRYTYKGMQIYVSQGAGTFGPPLRIGTSNELSHIVLVPAK
jgi:predicted MPP superfamily phosphohydrolase